MKNVLLILGVLSLLMFSGCDGGKANNVIAVDDSAVVLQGDSIVIDVLDNDTATSTAGGVIDDESDNLYLGAITQTPTHGSATKNGNQIVYQHDGSAATTDSFKYEALLPDNAGKDVALVRISINQDGDDTPNKAPTADPQVVNLTNCNDSATTITLVGRDEDGDTLTYSIDTTNVSYGVVNLTDANTGTATFTINSPEANVECREGTSISFTFKVNDGTDDSDEATVIINPPPPE